MRPKKTHQPSLISLTSQQLSLSFTAGLKIDLQRGCTQPPEPHGLRWEGKQEFLQTLWQSDNFRRHFVLLLLLIFHYEPSCELSCWGEITHSVICSQTEPIRRSSSSSSAAWSSPNNFTTSSPAGQEKGGWKLASSDCLCLVIYLVLAQTGAKSNPLTPTLTLSHTYNLPAAWENTATDFSH